MNGLELGKFLQDMVDKDIIESVDTNKMSDAFGKYNILRIFFKNKIRMAIIDFDGNMTPFECDSIEYSSRKLIEFLIEDSLYLSKSIDDIANIYWN